jgi:cytidine deaminase
MPPSPKTSPTTQPNATPLDPEQRNSLRSHAYAAAAHAYTPYSGFRVGCALLLADGSVVTGCNVENTSFRLTCCAEQSAITAAVAQHGPGIRIAAAVVVNRNGAACTPCGACRQMLIEFTLPHAEISYPGEGGVEQSSSIEELLPAGFHFEPPVAS